LFGQGISVVLHAGPYKNELLRKLSPVDLQRISRHLQLQDIEAHRELEAPGNEIAEVYFIESGLASVVASLPHGRNIEVAMIGREGMTGTGVILGSRHTAEHTVMHLAGSAYSLPSGVLEEALHRSPTLRRIFGHFVKSLLAQASSTALANGHAKLEERLARRLLMTHDRILGDEFPLTHEFLAEMLGVRRPGVTVALHILEGKGYIRSTRGLVTILNREGLEQEANGAYGRAEAEYERLFGVRLVR
jgi:CRP-like cAMP-binding protein